MPLQRLYRFLRQHGQFAGLLPSPAATEIFGDPGAVVSGTFRPNGVARAVAGGYQASGQWQFPCDVASRWLPHRR
jgi:hypothetical protein